MSEILLRVDGVSKRFGGFTALEDISVDIRTGERFGLIGPNGSGKTTLINCISGVLPSDGGSIRFGGEDITRLPAHKRTRRGIARSFQVPRPFRSMTVLENLLVAIDFAVIGHGLSTRQADAEVFAILDKIGLADKAHVSSSQLSQVELRKMELARAMAARPKLLISDEAMAGLAGSEIDEVLDVLLKLNAEGHYRHHDRAHHAGGDALLRARDVPRCRPHHLRGHAAGGDGRQGRARGLPWRLSSPFPA